ncbi:MAG: phosphoglycerate kinase [Gammaproteobacteria bacterium]|nr:phosphoglycerate kinase [Gammaproteobacteria bacterium]
MADLDLGGRRVLIREDLNAPIKDGRVVSDKRLRAAVPTLELALSSGARVMVLSHLGRPKEGQFDAAYSLAPVAEAISGLLGRPVPLLGDWLDAEAPDSGEIVLCENVRFLPGEKANDEALAKRMAALCDVFVMDAFGTAHRAQASTYGVAQFAPTACAGPLLVGELEALDRALGDPARPLIAVVGGSKVSTKLEVLSALAARVDVLIPGGGIANTLLAARGANMGRSLYEADMLGFASQLLDGEFGEVSVPLPTDVVVGPSLDDDAKGTVKVIADIADSDMVLDIGPQTAAGYANALRDAGTILWNGPVGVFEHPEFAAGTKSLAAAVAASPAFSIAGGGDTLAAIEQFDITDQVSYISTGGGAFLEYVQGEKLPAVEILEARA